MALTRIANIASTIPDDSIANVKMANIVQSKNILINGDMSVAQRSTSASSITSGGYHACDRWKEDMTSGGTWTISQSTTVPTGQGFATSLKMDCTTANGSLSANSELMVQQRIEGRNLQYLKKGTSSAESTTLSFWVRSNKTGTYICELQDVDNTRQISKSYTISVADTWEKKTITFPGDTTGALDNNSDRSLDCSFYLAAGSDLSSGTLSTTWTAKTDANRAVGQVNLADSTSNEWYITGAQLETGDTASEFEFLPVDLNLFRCQRYFFSLGGSATYQTYGYGMCFSSSGGMIGVPYPTTMRTAPTVATETLASFVTKSGSQLGGAPTSLVADFPGINFANVELGGLSSMTDKDALRLYTNNSTATRLEFNSEL
jgi:hypothetical protein